MSGVAGPSAGVLGRDRHALAELGAGDGHHLRVIRLLQGRGAAQQAAAAEQQRRRHRSRGPPGRPADHALTTAQAHSPLSVTRPSRCAILRYRPDRAGLVGSVTVTEVSARLLELSIIRLTGIPRAISRAAGSSPA